MLDSKKFDILKSKVRGLTRAERRGLNQKGINLLSLDGKTIESMLFELIDIVYPNSKDADALSYKQEEELASQIINLTFSVDTEEVKN